MYKPLTEKEIATIMDVAKKIPYKEQGPGSRDRFERAMRKFYGCPNHLKEHLLEGNSDYSLTWVRTFPGMALSLVNRHQKACRAASTATHDAKELYWAIRCGKDCEVHQEDELKYEIRICKTFTGWTAKIWLVNDVYTDKQFMAQTAAEAAELAEKWMERNTRGSDSILRIEETT